MRNLIRFIVRYHFFILFLIFEILSIFLFIQNNRFQKASFLNFTNEVGGAIHKRVNGISEYLNLRTQNEGLVLENADLRNQLSKARRSDTVRTTLVRDTIWKVQYEYLPARVVENSVNQQNNHLVIEGGALHGIQPGMAVICPTGAVGITKAVSPNYSLVISVLNRSFKLSTRISRNGYFGSLIWPGTDDREASLTEIPFHVDLKKGDSLVTSGYSAIFPPGIPVGIIQSFTKPAGTNFYEIQVSLATDFRKLGHVYVVKNLMAEEFRQLENKKGDDL